MNANKEERIETLLALTLGVVAIALCYAFLWFSTIFE